MDKDTIPGDYLKGFRRKQNSSGGYSTEEIHAKLAGEYLIAVMADSEQGEICRGKVFEYHQYLTNQPSPDQASPDHGSYANYL